MSVFQFKQFSIHQENTALKVGTDAMVFGALLPSNSEGLALDVGTGTGVLALMLAQKNNALQIDALELDTLAIKDAQFNFSQSKFNRQLRLYQGDFLDFTFPKKYDLIVSNPPYFQQSLKSMDEHKNKARHDETMPLNLMIPQVAKILNPGGHFWLILPASSWEKLKIICFENGLFLNEEIAIFGKANSLSRKIGKFSFKQEDITQKNLVIRDLENNYSSDYKKLTQEFHSKEL